ncbi:hypothetical protein [Apilactobacillus xinyiensis]|uniref:hypothetical protein n=1 Tax=Apilactobacillus xinyiensis TaxID=2841032 RepID=UPI00200E41D5|nr:hypothetical protein [Apilactobacillus xinyiensis]MCL0329826.1 hypothetical protein [Apilactobacillus xinyiensis]
MSKINYKKLALGIIAIIMFFTYSGSVSPIHAKKAPKVTLQNGQGNNFSIAYNYKKYKSYNREIADKSDTSNLSNHEIFLKGITYYKMSGKYGIKTAVNLKLLMRNNAQSDFNQNIYFFDTSHDNYLLDSKGNKLRFEWKHNSAYNNIGISAEQDGNVTFVSNKHLPLSNFKNITLNYWVNVNQINGHNYSARIKY